MANMRERHSMSKLGGGAMMQICKDVKKKKSDLVLSTSHSAM